jgi:hypothetical protein
VAQTQNQAVNLDIENSKLGDINVLNSMSANLMCLQTSKDQSTLQQNITNALNSLVKQDAEASQPFFSLNVSANVSEQQQQIINRIASNTQISNIQNAVDAQSGGQVINGKIIGSTVGDINISVQGSAVLQAVQNDSVIASSVQDLANSMATTTQQQATSGLNTTAIVAIVLAVCCSICLVSGILMLSGGPQQQAPASPGASPFGGLGGLSRLSPQMVETLLEHAPAVVP